MDSGKAMKPLGITVDENNIEYGCKEIVKVVRPIWQPTSINIKNLEGGHMNHMMVCYTEGFQDAIVIRVFGDKTDGGNRDVEILVTQALSNCNLAPRVLCLFQNGICTEFIEGETFTWEEESRKNLKNSPKIYRAMASAAAKLHSSKTLEELKQFNPTLISKALPIDIIERDLKHKYPIPTELDDDVKRRLVEDAPPKSVMDEEFEFILKKIEDRKMKKTFGNLDMNHTNFIYDSKTDKAWMVDFELCNTSYIAYDIASFLGAIWYGLEYTPERLFPPKDIVIEWLKVYLDTSLLEDSGQPVDIEDLYKDVKFMFAVYNFLIVTYTVCKCEPGSTTFLEDISVAKARIKMYFSQKDVLLEEYDNKEWN